MLHILLLILKIIGIILAVILGILLLLIGIVLFVPIRYEVSAKCDGTIDSLKAKVKATWLLHLVRADVFLKGKKVKWKVRLAWLKKTNAVGGTNRKEEKDNETEKDESEKVEETAVKDEVSEEIPEVGNEKCEEASEEVEEHRLEESNEEHSEGSESTSETGETTAEESEKESVSDKIKKLTEKIKVQIQNICDKIKELLQKKDKIEDFLTDRAHVNAFKKVKKELFTLLKRLKPKKTDIKVRFGFDDPCTTGQVLAGISILYPWFGETTEIIPDFENQVLKGTVYLKGRIRFCHFAVLALKLLLCKDVRMSYKDIRNFKL